MNCRDCIHHDVCKDFIDTAFDGFLDDGDEAIYDDNDMRGDDCEFYQDRSRFVELKSAEWIEDEDMYGDHIFRCSNCEARFVLEEGTPEDNEYYYCPTCGAKSKNKP